MSLNIFQKSPTAPQLVQQIYGKSAANLQQIVQPYSKSTTNLRLIAQMEFEYYESKGRNKTTTKQKKNNKHSFNGHFPRQPGLVSWLSPLDSQCPVILIFTASQDRPQESLAIAKMTARCAQYMGTCPENFRESLSRPTVTCPDIFNGLLFRAIL